MKWSRVFAMLAVVLTSTAVTVEAAGAAGLPPLVGTCGMVVTASAKLANDVTCNTASAAITISGSPNQGITLDLGGHTVSTTGGQGIVILGQPGGRVDVWKGRIIGGAVDIGDGLLAPPTTTSSARFDKVEFVGLGVTAFYDAITVQRGRFFDGANVTGENDTWKVTKNTFTGNGTNTAVDLVGSVGIGSITHNKISGYSTGVSVTDGNAEVRVFRNKIIGNGTGVRVGGTAGSVGLTGRIDFNHIESGQGDGLLVGDGALSDIRSNKISLNAGDGIRVNPTGGSPINVSVRGTRATYNGGIGIHVPASNPPDLIITDGGFNKARYNLGGQCTNIAC